MTDVCFFVHDTTWFSSLEIFLRYVEGPARLDSSTDKLGSYWFSCFEMFGTGSRSPLSAHIFLFQEVFCIFTLEFVWRWLKSLHTHSLQTKHRALYRDFWENNTFHLYWPPDTLPTFTSHFSWLPAQVYWVLMLRLFIAFTRMVRAALWTCFQVLHFFYFVCFGTCRPLRTHTTPRSDLGSWWFSTCCIYAGYSLCRLMPTRKHL